MSSWPYQREKQTSNPYTRKLNPSSGQEQRMIQRYRNDGWWLQNASQPALIKEASKFNTQKKQLKVFGLISYKNTFVRLAATRRQFSPA
jgi:hypothetical protein